METKEKAATEYVTTAELVELIAAIKGCTFATVTTRKPAKLNKKNRETGEARDFEVTETKIVNAAIGANYAAGVSRQRGREGQEAPFEAAPRAWGERVGDTAIIQHRGGIYVETFPQRTLAVAFIDASTGQPIDAEALDPYRPARKASSGRQGTAKTIKVRTLTAETIVSVRMAGKIYVVADRVAQARRKLDAGHFDTPASTNATVSAMLPELTA